MEFEYLCKFSTKKQYLVEFGKRKMFFSSFILFIGLSVFCIHNVHAVWPVTGRHDDSWESLSLEQRAKITPFRTDFKEADITTSDGITLKSIVFDPKPEKVRGKNPLLIFISSWGVNKWEYVVPAHEYAKKGYTVVSYTARGFWGSGGEINLAGLLDQADISTVIDWALANTNADPDRIGLSGISYGGGLSLLAAANDKRVKSAVSMSCWTDLAESLLGNGETIRVESTKILQALAYLFGEVGDDLELLFSDYFKNTDLDYIYTVAYNSSSVHFIDRINQNGAAIFIANAFGDTLLPPDQFPNQFYNKLTTNKHLEFSPGDHAGPEMLGLFGISDEVWTRAGQWNDYYVRDAKKDALSTMSPIILSTSYNSKEIETYKTWEEVTNSFMNFQLDASEHLSSVSKNLRLKDTELATITTGTNAGINGGVAIVTATVTSIRQKPLSFNLNDISRQYAAVFKTDAVAQSTPIRGTTKFNVNIIPKTSSNGTLVMYLLDLDLSTNVGKLITFAPWTFKNAVVGQVLNLDTEITMIAYDLSAKNALALVIQSHDPLFLDQSPAGAQIAFVSGSLAIPLHA